MKRKIDIFVISDTHLGTYGSHAKEHQAQYSHLEWGYYRYVAIQKILLPNGTYKGH